MSINRIALSAALAVLLSTPAMAQQDGTRAIDFTIEEEAVEGPGYAVEEAATEAEHAHAHEDEPSIFTIEEDAAEEPGHAVEEAATGAEHAHAHEEPHGGQERPRVRQAPEKASASLEHVTWELLSRAAAQLLSGNRATLLSGNEPEVLSDNQTNLASGNELQFLSGNKISLFSNIKIEIHISGVTRPADLMGGRREIRVETSDAPQLELHRERRDEPREIPRDRPPSEFRRPVPEFELDEAAEPLERPADLHPEEH